VVPVLARAPAIAAGEGAPYAAMWPATSVSSSSRLSRCEDAVALLAPRQGAGGAAGVGVFVAETERDLAHDLADLGLVAGALDRGHLRGRGGGIPGGRGDLPRGGQLLDLAGQVRVLALQRGSQRLLLHL
jgi:hypothetical protein